MDFVFVPATYIYAQIRDSAGNRMPVASRVEFCIGAECLAVFVGRNYDENIADCYGVIGSSFLVFAGRNRINVARQRFTYNDHTEVDEIDRFDLGTYTFLELLRVFYWDRLEWRCSSIDKTLAEFLQSTPPETALSPLQLEFITLDVASIGVYFDAVYRN